MSVFRAFSSVSLKFTFLTKAARVPAKKFTEMAVTAAKKKLRQDISNALKKITTEEKLKQSKKVHERLFNLAEYKKSTRISLYLSTSDEIDTTKILKNIFELKKLAFVPRYNGKTMEMVRVSSMEDYESLPLTKWNIKQPTDNDVRENALETGGLDLVILPGVAFSLDGKRLGHGMGYYDKFLHSCMEKSHRMPYLIGLAFNEQIKEDIPTTEEDVNLNLVLTEHYN
ncbi:5-formyltetrahydrofolate cyclo-ligase isoform X1 [Neodiprion virginianus]|uniref:5-formyltetrahydrofolate cyclo-ligase isoform X1 n=2 Tax=Neodiprion virginianus TaxID=2961670 RepID=UPI001EE69FE2|nr:5-formyltetrahydrofolate cyclo-ligase isoform X1 [Neodiprion virginianus]